MNANAQGSQAPSTLRSHLLSAMLLLATLTVTSIAMFATLLG